ncbi:hypothetical protein V2G26_010677 [Clonostachys chloroleuca]
MLFPVTPSSLRVLLSSLFFWMTAYDCSNLALGTKNTHHSNPSQFNAAHPRNGDLSVEQILVIFNLGQDVHGRTYQEELGTNAARCVESPYDQDGIRIELFLIRTT